mmetsp:Transcript_18975/g.53499  ORF Transcript_18975/g.53499 Transcript_18975/m.53499 type:complete len:222 (-) Transcript_18975:115-780(-)
MPPVKVSHGLMPTSPTAQDGHGDTLVPRAPPLGELPPVRRPHSALRRRGSRPMAGGEGVESPPKSPSSLDGALAGAAQASAEEAEDAELQASAEEGEEAELQASPSSGGSSSKLCFGPSAAAEGAEGSGGCAMGDKFRRRKGSANIGQVMMSRSVNDIRSQVIESRRLEQNASSAPGHCRLRRPSVVEATFNGGRPSLAEAGAEGAVAAAVGGGPRRPTIF